ncbi:MAG TPA: AsmA-like C-terminal region-containing protein [Chitinophagaceae bacterium]|nr:AsmA-like C-terminal region-containing protein [Chitinophagaceae bacterium]
MLKKIIKITLIVLLVLIGVAFAAPFIFKDKITELVKKEINNSLDAKVDFAAVDISFFRHFPKVALGIKNIQVTGINEFAADTLFAAKDIDVAVNIMSVIKGSEYKIYSVRVDEPRIHAIVTKEGKANWDIVKPDTAAITPATEQKPFQLNLQSYAISNGYIRYDDATSNMSSEITGLNHSGSGDFTSDLFTLSTKTGADAVSFSYGNIPYLSKTKITVDAAIQVDNKTNKYSFKTDKVILNELKLTTEGFFQLVNDSVYNMDIIYDAPSTDFKNILSLIPVIYQKDFASVKTNGKALFNGFVKGIYSSKQIPAYNLNLAVKDGFFQYPDLPKPVKNINFSVKVDNPDGITDHTVVNIPQGHIEIDNDPFDFRLLIKTPVSDMFVDGAAKGKLDLSKVAQLVKLEAGTQLAGLLNADIHVNGYMSAVEKKQYEKFNAAGTVNLNNFFYASKAYPDGVQLHTLLASFNPQNVTLNDLSGQYMKTNFTANGTIDNLLPYVLQNQSLTGLLNIKADQLNLNDWMGTAADTTTKGTEAAAPFAVPANLSFTVNAAVDKVHYDKIDMQDLSGSLVLKDETVILENIKCNLLDGTMNLDGSYATKTDKKKPAISLHYDIKGFDIEKTFSAFNTVQKLMPVGKFLSGKLTSQLSFSGKLGDNMMPDLASITGNGNLLLVEGFLKKFAPVEKLASLLNIKELESFSLKDVKTYFEFANGKVMVKPFKLKVKDIDMEIGGMHGFDQSLDYLINMKIPRALVGDKGNAYVNNLVSQVNNKGIPLTLGDFINLKVNMGGSITNPVLKTDVKQAGSSLANDLKQQAADFAKAKIDSTKKAVTIAVKDSIASLKKQAVQTAGDEIKKQLFGKGDTSKTSASDGKKNIGESAKGLLQNISPFGKKKKTQDTLQH